MLFKVTKLYGRGTEIIAGSFNQLAEAQEFMHLEAKKDAHLKVQAIYRLYEFDEVIKEIDTAKLDSTPAYKQAEQTGGAGAGKQTGFRPTPLATTLKPQGSVHQQKENDEDDNGSSGTGKK